MSAVLVFKQLAEAEIAEAFAWYAQPEIDKGRDFIADLERVERFIRMNPSLYPLVEGDIHRANLRRFPYSLFYVVDGETVSVLSCFHQHRDPGTGPGGQP